jgi:hypothetical protein
MKSEIPALLTVPSIVITTSSRPRAWTGNASGARAGFSGAHIEVGVRQDLYWEDPWRFVF